MNEVISDKHIGRIADTMPEWEGSNADALDLTPTDVNAIKTEYSKKLKLQKYDRIHAMIYLYYIDLVITVGAH